MKIVNPQEKYVGKSFIYLDILYYKIKSISNNKDFYNITPLPTGRTRTISITGFEMGLINKTIKLL